MKLTDLPTLNAFLNGTSAVLLSIGRWHIAHDRRRAHRNTMLAALSTSAAFLVSYLYYHAHVGSVRFQHRGAVRTFYLTLLASHTILAVVLVPLVAISVTYALRGNFRTHRRFARFTWPTWMYVSITGVIVYLMLYHFDR